MPELKNLRAPANKGASVLGGLVGIDDPGSDHEDERGDPDASSNMTIGVLIRDSQGDLVSG